MGDCDMEMEERKLLEATLRVVQLISGASLDTPYIAQDNCPSSPESSDGIFDPITPKYDETQESDTSILNVSESAVVEEENSMIVQDSVHTPDIQRPSLKDSNDFRITFYFSDGEVITTTFIGSSTCKDILAYLKRGKYRDIDWTSVYCDLRCREPKMNLGKLRARQTLLQSKLPSEFSVDVKIQQLF